MSTAIAQNKALENEGKRRPESAFQALYIASKLHQDVRASAEADVGLEVRRAVQSDKDLSALEPAIKRVVGRAAAAVTEKSIRLQLLKLCKDRSFLEAKTSLQRSLLDRLVKRGIRAETIAAMAGAIRCPAFSKLGERAQEALASAMITLAGTGAARGLIQLLSVKGLLVLKDEEQRGLINYFTGIQAPEDIAPMRKNRLELVWNVKRRELGQLVRRPAFVRAKPEEQANQIREYLHGRAEDVFFVDATEQNGHGVVVFGAPNNPRNISYGRRWVLSATGKPIARIYNPDPTVQSSWRQPKGNSDIKYSYRAVKISRFVAWRLLNTIEKTFPITDDERVRPGGLGLRRPCPGKGAFLEEVLSILMSLSARSGKVEMTSGVMQAGRCIETKRPGASKSDEALAKLLSA